MCTKGRSHGLVANTAPAMAQVTSSFGLGSRSTMAELYASVVRVLVIRSYQIAAVAQMLVEVGEMEEVLIEA